MINRYVIGLLGLSVAGGCAGSAEYDVAGAEQGLSVNDCPAGYNIIQGTSHNDVLTGTAGSDCILGKGGDDTIQGLGGNDIIDGAAGKDTILGGGPFAANPLNKTAYPLQWLALILPPALHINLLIVLHLLVAGWGMWCWARSLDLPEPAAALSALAYVFAPKARKGTYCG